VFYYSSPCRACPLNLTFSECRHVALKLFIGSKVLGAVQDDELDMYKQIEKSSNDHPGRSAIRSLLDSFDIDGPNGRRRCLVHPPLWETLLDVRHRNPIRRLPSPVMAFVLQRLFQALDFLHTECHVAHTDIKEGSILFGADESVLSALEQEKLNEPCPMKELEGRTIYLTREFSIPKDYGEPVLCDLGSAVRLGDDAEHREDIQPNVYQAPEIILDIPWTYSVDIWNVGCMVSTNDSNERSRAKPSSFVRRYGTHSRVST
jgi:serine/threonine-protein kinase SRPK3